MSNLWLADLNDAGHGSLARYHDHGWYHGPCGTPGGELVSGVRLAGAHEEQDLTGPLLNLWSLEETVG